MKKTIRFIDAQYSATGYDEGYIRQGYEHLYDDNLLQPASDRVLAHDFVEHPKGHPTGTLVDEVAAFGAIIVLRIHETYPMSCPIQGIADELREMFGYYKEGAPHKDILPNRKRCFKYLNYDMELIAELVTDDTALQRNLQAWFAYGHRMLLNRFGDLQTAYWVYQEITEACKNIDEDSFALHINTNNNHYVCKLLDNARG